MNNKPIFAAAGLIIGIPLGFIFAEMAITKRFNERLVTHNYQLMYKTNSLNEIKFVGVNWIPKNQ